MPLGAWVASNLDWRLNYAAIAVMAAAASLALFLRLPKGMPGDTQTIRERLRVLRNPGILPALGSTVLFMAGAAVVMIYIAAVTTALGIGPEALPFVLFANGLGSVACSLSAGRLADWLGSRLAVTAAMLCVCLLLGVFVALPYLPMPARLPVLLVAFGLMGYVGWGFWIAHCSHMASLAPTAVPVAISLDMAALNIGMATAAGVGGLVVDTWGAAILPVVAVPVVVLAFVIWLATPAPAVEEPVVVGNPVRPD